MIILGFESLFLCYSLYMSQLVPLTLIFVNLGRNWILVSTIKCNTRYMWCYRYNKWNRLSIIYSRWFVGIDSIPDMAFYKRV